MRGLERSGYVLSLAALLTMVGCGAVDRALQRRVAVEARDLSPSVEDDAAVQRVGRDTADHGLPAPNDTPLPPEAGLDDYIRIALRDNPSIARAIRQVQVLGYRVPQVASLDDPMINLIPPLGDMTETAAGMMQAQVGISEKIPFPGKLTGRAQIVEQSVRMALDALADARISTVAQVQRAYYGYCLADLSIGIDRRSQALLRQIRDVASARYRAGAATQQDVLRAEVELYDLTNRIITLQQQRATAAAQLNSLMNRTVDAPLPSPQPFELAQVDWKLPEVMTQAVASNPRLARLQHQVERDLAAVKLAHLNYFPDLTAGFGYTFISPTGLSPVANGQDVWNFALGFNVPIWWQRLRAGVLEGNAQVLASVEEYAEVRNLLSFQLQDTLLKIDAQYRQAVLYRDLIVPRAWQTVEVSTSGYRAGALEFTALIDNWRKWLDSSLAYDRARTELEQRFADLQQLIGVQVARMPEAESSEQGGGAMAEPTSATSMETKQ